MLLTEQEHSFRVAHAADTEQCPQGRQLGSNSQRHCANPVCPQSYCRWLWVAEDFRMLVHEMQLPWQAEAMAIKPYAGDELERSEENHLVKHIV